MPWLPGGDLLLGVCRALSTVWVETGIVREDFEGPRLLKKTSFWWFHRSESASCWFKLELVSWKFLLVKR